MGLSEALGTSEQYVSAFCSGKRLQAFFVSKECRLVHLSQFFGYKVGICKICDNCVSAVRPPPRKNPYAKSSKLVLSKVVRVETNSSINVLLKRLRQKCLVCSFEACSGEECLYGRCYQCGGKHAKAKCPSRIREELKGRACFGCYVRFDGDHHSVRDCPVKRRFRRLLFAKYQVLPDSIGSHYASKRHLMVSVVN